MNKLNKLNKFKVVLLGECGVGKTSVVNRLTRDIFYEHISQTIGSSFCVYKDESNNNYFELWDTAGQERFACLSQLYYRDAEIIICVFDLTDLDTLGRIINYIKKIKIESKTYHKFIIVANKMDIVHADDLVDIRIAIDKKFESYDLANDLDTNEMEIIYMSAKYRTNFDDFKNKLLLCAHIITMHRGGVIETPDNIIKINDDNNMNNYLNYCYC